MKFCCLGSGSAGNCTLVSEGNTRVLVDIGISVRALMKRLALIGEHIDQITDVLISHEHGDHIDGLLVFVREMARRGRPVNIHLSHETAAVINWKGYEKPPVRRFRPGSLFAVGDLAVSAFTIPHDCVDGSAFTLQAGPSRVGIAVDLGYVPDALRARFRGCQVVMIESNHDHDLLRYSPYPQSVKDRVAGPNGHLSNAEALEYLSKDLDPAVQHVVLGHLSRQNNTPEIATMGAAEALEMRGMFPRLHVAHHTTPSEVIEL